MSKAAKFYQIAKARLGEAYEAAGPQVAGVADDIRHKVVEEGWFGKKVTGNIIEDEPSTDNVEIKIKAVSNHYTLYQSVWGAEPEPHDLYGKTPDTAELRDVPEQDDGQTPDF